MTQKTTVLQVSTRGKGLYEFTDEVERWLAASGLAEPAC